MAKIAMIGGVGEESDFSEALIKALQQKGFYIVAIARNFEKKPELIKKFENRNDIQFISGDLSNALFMNELIERLEQDIGAIKVYVHNAAHLVLKPFLEATSEDFSKSWDVCVKTAITASGALIPKMLKRGEGVLIFTGATASIKGSARAAPFAVSKFGLRALSQSLAREFGPQGLHVAHVVADGVIVGKRAQTKFDIPEDKCIQPASLADLYIRLIEQDSSCWTQEIDVRPSHENF